jgi:hypothetical protein
MSDSEMSHLGPRLRQVRLERIDRLLHQCDTIGQEQHALDPVRGGQLFDQRDRRPRLPGSRRHDEQSTALVPLLECAADGLDPVAADYDDRILDRRPAKAVDHAATREDQHARRRRLRSQPAKAA